MSYRRSETTEGLPSIGSNRGAMGDTQLRRSLTRLDDLDSTPRHVSFRPYSGDERRSRNYSPPRDRRSRDTSPVRPQSPRTRSPARCYSPTNGSRHINDLQEQIRILKEELNKKEQLILSSKTRTDLSMDRSAIEQSRGEIAALKVKVDNLTIKLREAEQEIDTCHTRIREYKSNCEQSKENEARQAALADSLRDRVRELEKESGSLESMRSASDAVVTVLKDEKRVSEEKIKDMELRMRTYIQERESAEVKSSSWEKRYQESLVILRSALNVDYNEPIDSMKLKIQEMVSENTTLKGRLCTAEDTLGSHELESRANRETIARLVNEVNTEQAGLSKYKAEIEALARERETAEIGRRDAQRECEVLRERLDASQKAWSATKRELEEKSKTFSNLDYELRDNSERAKAMQGRYQGLLEQISSMLAVNPSEEMIRDRIRQLQGQSKDGHSTISILEEKVRSQEDQLRLLYEQRGKFEQSNQRAELHIRDLEEKLRMANREMSNGDVYRDGLRGDKEKHLRFMERLGELMKMDRISAEVGFDMTGEALLARAAQLAKLEADALADRNTHIYNLQRKIKTMKEQLESKDLHLDLLRKKIGTLEERSMSRADLEKDREGELVKVRRLEKTCDKYSQQLDHARMEITDLKAQLLGSTKVQVDNQDLVTHCNKLENQVSQLDKIRQKQAKKITALKEDMHMTESGGEQRIGKAEGAIQSLTSELRTTKSHLDETSKREKQLVDLRTVLARMLGLDVNTLAVPDYEIISRLEKLIQAHHAHTLTNWSMDHALENMEDGLRSGYPSAKIYLGEPRAQQDTRDFTPIATPERRSRSPNRMPMHQRAASPERRRRSSSPTKVDTRKY